MPDMSYDSWEMKSDMITGLQIRMAMAALRWSLDDLAEKSGVSWKTAQRAARPDGIPSTSAQNLDAIERALAGAGIDFSDGGVRLADQ